MELLLEIFVNLTPNIKFQSHHWYMWSPNSGKVEPYLFAGGYRYRYLLLLGTYFSATPESGPKFGLSRRTGPSDISDIKIISSAFENKIFWNLPFLFHILFELSVIIPKKHKTHCTPCGASAETITCNRIVSFRM